jgi:uncharacterized repeat protein (TIGR01451 family)
VSLTAPSAGGSITNNASVEWPLDDPTGLNNSSSESTTVNAGAPQANLSLVKSASANPVNAGAAFSYTLAVSNAGPNAASSLSVTDSLPAGVGFVSATGSGWACNQAAGVVTCTRATLAVGAAPHITINVTAPAAGGTINNTATVSAATADPVTTNNSGTASVTVTPAQVTHDLSVVNLKAPNHVQFNRNKTTQSGRVEVTVLNRGSHAETFTSNAMLASLVSLTADSLGGCPDLIPVFRQATRTLPLTLQPGQQFELVYDVQFTSACINDPRKSIGSSTSHDDYRYTAVVHHSAIDGQADSRPENDVCPRAAGSAGPGQACPRGQSSAGSVPVVSTDLVMSGT